MRYIKELVSIIMPSYNAGKSISRAIESIIAQTYGNWELIIVDDGSEDETKKVVEAFKDSRISYVFQKNSGPANARNKGIDLARGQYICFIDSDDVVHKDYLMHLIDEIKLDDADVAMCNYVKMPNLNKVNVDIKNASIYKKKILSGDECAEKMFYKKDIMPYPFLKLFDRTKIEDIRFPENLFLGEDLVFNYNVFKKVNRAVYIDKVLYYHIENEDSITHCLNEKKAIDHFESLKSIYISAEEKFKIAIMTRMFIVAYDFLSQSNVKDSFTKELIHFVKKNCKQITKNKECSLKTRLLGGLTKISVPFCISICRIIKRINLKKAI